MLVQAQMMFIQAHAYLYSHTQIYTDTNNVYTGTHMFIPAQMMFIQAHAYLYSHT